jgi:hypothetical protein
MLRIPRQSPATLPGFHLGVVGVDAVAAAAGFAEIPMPGGADGVGERPCFRLFGEAPRPSLAFISPLHNPAPRAAS